MKLNLKWQGGLNAFARLHFAQLLNQFVIFDAQLLLQQGFFTSKKR